jgi:hypothetical protein
MSLAELMELIKDEPGCYRLLRYFKFANHQFRCRLCGSENEKVLADARKTKCADCSYTESLTAKTIFHRSRLSLTVLIPLVLSVVIGDIESAFEASQCLKICYNTAWKWHHRARDYFQLFVSPDNTQSVHYSFLLDVLFRRTTESPAEPAPGLKPDDGPGPVAVETRTQVEIQIPKDRNCAVVDCEDKEPVVRSANVQELVPAKHAVADEIPQPDDWIGVNHTLKLIKRIFHSGVGLKHAAGYTDQCIFITQFPGQALKFLAACMQEKPPPQPRSEFLTLPLMDSS